MNSPIRVVFAHISDVHLTRPSGFSPRYWGVKRGLGFLNWSLRRRFIHRRDIVDRLVSDIRLQAPDHVIIGGDLVNIGLPNEYDEALSWIRSLGASDRVSVVPGNHDIYVSLPSGEGVDKWHDYMSSDDGNGHSVLSSAPQFPFVRRFGPLALLGVNTARPTPPFVAAGEIGPEQLQRLGTMLEAARKLGLVRVVILHHPPLPGQTSKRRGLEDAEELVRLLERYGAELILHGHLHRDGLCWIERQDARIPVVGVGSGSAALEHHGETLARYNLVRMMCDDSKVAVEIETRGLLGPDGEVRHVLQRAFDLKIEKKVGSE